MRDYLQNLSIVDFCFVCSTRDAYAKLAQRRLEYESSGSEAVEMCYNAQIKVRKAIAPRGVPWVDLCVLFVWNIKTFDSALTPDNIMSSLGWPACIVYCQQPLTNQRPVLCQADQSEARRQETGNSPWPGWKQHRHGLSWAWPRLLSLSYKSQVWAEHWGTRQRLKYFYDINLPWGTFQCDTLIVTS